MTHVNPYTAVESITCLIDIPHGLVLKTHEPSRQRTLCGFDGSHNDPTNGHRADKALRTVGRVREEADISDLLCDLLHLSHKLGYSPMEVYRTGLSNFLLGACDKAEPTTEEVICKSGLRGWQCRLRDNYKDFEDFEVHCLAYDVHRRLGYKTSSAAWKHNPLIQGSVEPSDLRKVKPIK